MKKSMIFAAAMIFFIQTGLFSSPKKLGFVAEISPRGIALIHRAKGTSELKLYTEIFEGDIIELKKIGNVKILLTNLEPVTLKNIRKVKIQNDYSLLDVATGKKDSASGKKDKFATELAKNLSEGASRSGASKGSGDILTNKILNEIKETDVIEDEYLRHLARYYIYSKYMRRPFMEKEADYMIKLDKEGKGYNKK